MAAAGVVVVEVVVAGVVEVVVVPVVGAVAVVPVAVEVAGAVAVVPVAVEVAGPVVAGAPGPLVVEEVVVSAAGVVLLATAVVRVPEERARVPRQAAAREQPAGAPGAAGMAARPRVTRALLPWSPRGGSPACSIA